MSNVMKLLPLFFILPSCLAQTETQACDTRNDVRIKGKSNVGPLEVCWKMKNGYRWWPICGYNIYRAIRYDGYWNEISAGVVCRQLNFTDPSYQGS